MYIIFFQNSISLTKYNRKEKLINVYKTNEQTLNMQCFFLLQILYTHHLNQRQRKKNKEALKNIFKRNQGRSPAINNSGLGQSIFLIHLSVCKAQLLNHTCFQ